MARCNACAAPLPPDVGVCEYCGSQTDIDLKGIHEFTVTKPESSRVCPDCDIPLQTLDLQVDGNFFIERCDTCLGLFFDPGELEALMEKSVSNVFSINRKRIDAVIREKRDGDGKFAYRKCPVCRELMYRINFGARSGVIVDQCKTHGVWLDSGELKRLLEWKKAGGQLLHEQVRQRKEKEEKERQERLRVYRETGSPGTTDGFLSPSPSDSQFDLIDTVASVLGKLFK
jgi:Zn-finger nucleic acid-binding protein